MLRCQRKPTLGRIPHASTVEPTDIATIGIQLTQVNGPLARQVADLRRAFEVVAGPTWRDPWTVPAPLRGRELAKPIRVAIVLDPAGRNLQQVQDGVRKAADVLEQAGYTSTSSSRRQSTRRRRPSWSCSPLRASVRCGSG